MWSPFGTDTKGTLWGEVTQKQLCKEAVELNYYVPLGHRGSVGRSVFITVAGICSEPSVSEDLLS